MIGLKNMASKIKEVCIIAPGYPYKDDPFFAFVRPVAAAMADAGIKCTVIAPQSASSLPWKKKNLRPAEWTDVSDEGKEIRILQPKILTFSNIKLFGYGLSAMAKVRSSIKCFKKHVKNADCIYAHFWSSSLAAGKISAQTGIPAFAVTGESTVNLTTQFPHSYIQKVLPHINGVISVCTKNIEESKSQKLIPAGMPTVVLPNAVSKKDFNLIAKSEARKQLDFPEDATIGLFVGYFIERKGPLRVLEAAKPLKNLKLVFLGKGEQTPEGENVLYSGRVAHSEMVKHMCAADFLVLPTLAEGCCNAIVEAMVCGLPVISSDLPFNYDILDETNSIMVDPKDISQLSNAMKKLTTDAELRKKLAFASIIKSEDLFITKRVERILEFMEQNSK